MCKQFTVSKDVLQSIRNLKGNEMDMMLSRSTSHCYLYADKSTWNLKHIWLLEPD